MNNKKQILFLLLWADRKPVERRSVLLITIFMGQALLWLAISYIFAVSDVVVAASTLTGDLVKDSTDPAVHVVLEDSKSLCRLVSKNHYMMWSQYKAKGLKQWQDVKTTDLSLYSDKGPCSLRVGSLARTPTNPEVFFIQSNTIKRGFDAWATFVKFGYKSESVVFVTDEVLNQYTTGTKITASTKPQEIREGSVVKYPNKPTIYYIAKEGGVLVRREVVNEYAYFSNFGNDWNLVVTIPQSETYTLSSVKISAPDKFINMPHALSKTQTIATPFGVNVPGYEDLTDASSVSLKDAGAQYIRFHPFVWRVIEKEKGTFNWVNYNGTSIDEQIEAAKKQNLSVVGEVFTTPVWARKSVQKCKSSDDEAGEHTVPKNPTDFGNFMTKIVERYKPGGAFAKEKGWGTAYGISYWELWNEPDLEHFWCGGSDQEFIALLKEGYNAVKKQDPNAIVLIGGISGEEGLSGRSIDKVLESYYNLGAKDYFDVMAFHFYPKDSRPTMWDDPVYGIRKRIEMVKETMKRYQDESKPIWNTEGCYGNATNERAGASYSIRYFITQLAHGIQNVFWFLTRDYNWIPDLPCGLADVSLNKKLGFFTYKLMTEKLTGSDFFRTVPIMENQDNVYVYKFTKNNKTIYVAWWDYWKEPNYKKGNIKTVSLNVSSSSWKITNAVPSASSGGDVKDFSTAFTLSNATAKNSVLYLQLGEDPIFVEESL